MKQSPYNNRPSNRRRRALRRCRLEACEPRRLLTTVVEITPPPNSHLLATGAVVTATFDVNVNPATATDATIHVLGSQSGRRSTAAEVDGQQVTMTPEQDFHPGERVQWTITNQLSGLPGDALLNAHVWQYRVQPSKGTAITDSGGRIATPNVSAVVVGDIDGDGDLDSLAGDHNGNVSVWLNQGDGEFVEIGQSQPLNSISEIELGDVDGDGDLDAFVASRREANRVLLNDGAGSFSDSGQQLSDVHTNDVTLADIDGDGDLDALVANWYYREIGDNHIWINDGSGHFAMNDQTLGNAGRAIEAGDIDGDGDLDVVVGTYGYTEGSSIVLWLNDGDGHFVVAADNPDAYNPAALALGDLDSDGDLDIFAGGSGQFFEGPFGVPSVVLLNDGDGAFTPSGQSLGDSQTNEVYLADFDVDGDLDAFLSNGGGSDVPAVWINNGFANFTQATLPPHVPSSDIAIGDLDGNGSVDALVAGNSQTSIWRNADRNLDISVDLTDDTYTYVGGDQISYHLIVTNHGPEDAADVTVATRLADRIQDVTWTCAADNDSSCSPSGAGNVVDLVSLKSGATVTYALHGTIATTSDAGEFGSVATVSLANGELDLSARNDRFEDVNVVVPVDAVPRINSTSVPTTVGISVDYSGLLDAESVSFESLTVHGSQSGSLTVEDATLTVEGNQITVSGDLPFHKGEVVQVTSTEMVRTASGAPMPNFTWQYQAGYAVSARSQGNLADSGQRLGNNGTSAVALADFDQDGDLDVVQSNFRGDRVLLNENGMFSDSGQSLGESYQVLPFGDFDGDGDLDIISGEHVWHNQGDAQFAKGALISDRFSAVAVGDIDGDGDLDLLTASYRSNAVYTNDGHGNFSNAGQDFGASITASVALEDFDGDGDLDAYFGNLGTHAGGPHPDQVWFNNGRGEFFDSGQRIGEGEEYASLATSDVVAVGDIDGDGDLDVATATSPSFVFSQPGVRFWINDGRGFFSQSLQMPDEEYPSVKDIALADIDGDGDLDLVESLYDNPARNRVWRNVGSRQFVQVGSLPTESNTLALGLGDLDGNGTIDAFFATQRSDEVWFNPLLGDYDDDGQLTADDIGHLCAAAMSGAYEEKFDVDRDGDVDQVDHQVYIEDVLQTSLGDANLDGAFDSEDIVHVFIAGEYLDGISANSRWETGDWNCDGEFNEQDLVHAFTHGIYVNSL